MAAEFPQRVWLREGRSGGCWPTGYPAGDWDDESSPGAVEYVRADIARLEAEAQAADPVREKRDRIAHAVGVPPRSPPEHLIRAVETVLNELRARPIDFSGMTAEIHAGMENYGKIMDKHVLACLPEEGQPFDPARITAVQMSVGTYYMLDGAPFCVLGEMRHESKVVDNRVVFSIRQGIRKIPWKPAASPA